MAGAFRVGLGSVRKPRNEATGRGPERDYNADFHGRENNQSSYDCRGQW
jgi:hypothetical protein